MSDDTEDGGNVVAGPGKNNQQQGQKQPQTPDSILASIKGEFKQQQVKEFKVAATAVLKEIDAAQKVVKLAEAKLAKLVSEFQAETA